MVDRAAQGAAGEPFELDVERGKIYELARAVKAEHPAYFEKNPVAPPIFLTTTFLWESLVPGSNPWEKVAMDQRRGMHAEQEYIFHGPPPRAGARLTCTSRIESIFEKVGKRGGKMVFAVMVTEFHDEAGKLVATARLTGVETERAPEESPR
jgi:hypothetical protein